MSRQDLIGATVILLVWFAALGVMAHHAIVADDWRACVQEHLDVYAESEAAAKEACS